MYACVWLLGMRPGCKLLAPINIKSERRPHNNYKSWKQNLSFTYLGSCRDDRVTKDI